MKTILLSNNPLIAILIILLVLALGVVWHIIKIPEDYEEIVDNTINSNIQSINRMGYRPEEDDEITGYENAEKPYIEKNSGHINEHINSVINKT